ncbi:MAG TPA: vitamin K epoxide reductase family protein [Mycobacteriales bacterium]|nr:vitamin K epoxide reductase family protein [Mycobacteriales bacterium]
MPDQQPAVNARWAWRWSLPLALLGLADSVYLTYTHFHPGALVCSATGHINCAKVTTSSESEIFGHIPVAIVGLVYFAVMTLLMTPWAWQMTNQWVHRFRLAAVGGAMGMVIYLVTVEIHLKAICEYCTGVHIINFLLFFVVLAAFLFRPIEGAAAPAPPARKSGSRRR